MKTLQRNECKILLRNREGKPCATVQDGILRRTARKSVHRRRLTREWKQQKAIELRQKGWSTRRIASVLGVSQPTILNWPAQESGDKNLSPEATNAILGRDGTVQNRCRSASAKPRAELLATPRGFLPMTKPVR